MDRRSLQRETTRARLFEEAVEEFKRCGFADTEIAVITERVGVSRGAFYLYFHGKDEVLRQLLVLEERRIAAAARTAISPCDALAELLGAVVDTVLAAERRLGRRLVRDLCAAQFRPEITQLVRVDDHPLGLMLLEEMAARQPDADPDVAMLFLTSLLGLLATDEGSRADRRRLDLLVRLVTGPNQARRPTTTRRTRP